MFYVVYLPSLLIVCISNNKEGCQEYYKNIGHDYDEDYKIMKNDEFIELVKRIY